MTNDPATRPFRAPRLTVRRLAPAVLDSGTRAAMYALFARSYGGTDAGRFTRDLDAKTDVFLLRDSDGAVRGFSTLEVSRHAHESGEIRVCFSGDTVIDRPFWGSPVFSYAWVRHIGHLAACEPGLPLYWLLTVKGHRTYRFLPTFARCFVPDWRGGDDPALLRLRDRLAAARFGAAYDPASGLVRHPAPQGHLAADLAEAAPREMLRPDVRYFMQANPGWRQGDELVCLCRLDETVMKPLTRRLFRQGMAC